MAPTDARFRRPALSLLALLLALSGRFAIAQEAQQAAPPEAEAPSGKFVRLERDENKDPLSLQTAVVSFTKPGEANTPTVDLVGVVHVGDADYYAVLDKALADYDVVLYELVAPEGTRIPKGQRASSNHMAGAVQNGMKDVLELEHQLENIDYTRENMLHADMTPEEFNKSMSDRGESFLGMMFKMMGQAMAQQSAQPQRKTSDLSLLMALFDDNRALTLKRVMAEQFEDLEGSMAAFGGNEGSTIITERNKVALGKLTEQLAAGKRRIAIFYGAGHLPDMEKRLNADFGLTRTAEHWLTAWNLASPVAAAK